MANYLGGRKRGKEGGEREGGKKEGKEGGREGMHRCGIAYTLETNLFPDTKVDSEHISLGTASMSGSLCCCGVLSLTLQQVSSETTKSLFHALSPENQSTTDADSGQSIGNRVTSPTGSLDLEGIQSSQGRHN